MRLPGRRLARSIAFGLGLVFVSGACGAGQDYLREDLRLPFAAAGPAGLEAMLLRPAPARRYPLALISHGSPRDPAERAQYSPYRLYGQALAFARRGFAALVVMRRGYGTSGGEAETSGPCAHRNYLSAVHETARDLKAAVAAARERDDIAPDGIIAVGQSAGGLASVALAAEAPRGLAAVINFAGGRGSRADNEVCDEADLVATFAALGQTARVPMIWIYAENDRYFAPDLARRFHAAFTGSGGRAEFVAAPAFGQDGHGLFAQGIDRWTPLIDDFLKRHGLASGVVLDPPEPARLPSPRMGREGASDFANYLRASPHKAIAISPRGAFGWRSGLRSEDEARSAAMEACTRHAADCRLYAVDDALAR